jgi:hypothetical protein
MSVKSKLAFVLFAAVLAAPALAQQPGTSGAAAVTSEPGKATAVRTVEVSAQVVGIDKATRTLTLKGSKGEVVDVVASDEVKRFDEIKVGDSIVARYIEALTLELKKTRVAAGDVKVREELARSGRAAGGARGASGQRHRRRRRRGSGEEHDHDQGA